MDANVGRRCLNQATIVKNRYAQVRNRFCAAPTRFGEFSVSAPDKASPL